MAIMIAQLVYVVAHTQPEDASSRTKRAVSRWDFRRVANNKHQRAVVAPDARVRVWVRTQLMVEDQQLIDRLSSQDLSNCKPRPICAPRECNLHAVARIVPALLAGIARE